MKKLTAALALLTISGSVWAQKELKTTGINLFKNGTYFVVKEGVVNASKGNWSMSMLNFNPLLSTFWITTTKDAPINRIEYITDTIKTKRYIYGFQDALNANKGKKVKLTYTIGTGNNAISNAKGVLENFYPSTGMAKIKTPEGSYLFLNTNSIHELFFEENPNETLSKDSLARVAKIFFDKEKSNTPIKITYMQTGMNWVPSYSIKMIDDSKLQLSMNALVENFSEDIKDAELTLTLGAANFKYGTQLDPITQAWVSAAGGGNAYNYNWNNNYNYQATYNNALPMQTLSADSYAGAVDEVAAYNDYATYTTAGTKDEDLFRYKLGKVNIPKNAKTSFAIFSNELPFEDIYEVNLYDIVNYATNQRINNNEDQNFEVFHSLKMTNTTGVPFTTGPCFVQDKNLQPMAQDQVKYTAVGGKVKVQLAKATDILVKNTEEEISSEDKSKKYNNYYYKKVTIKGSIKLENLQPKKIKLNITKTVNGDIKEVNESGTTKKSGKYNGLNPSSETEWTVSLDKGEKKVVNYTYDVYVYQGY